MLCGVTPEDLDRRRQQLLATTQEDLRALGKLFRILADQGRHCIHGNEERLRQNASLFDRLIQIS